MISGAWQWTHMLGQIDRISRNRKLNRRLVRTVLSKYGISGWEGIAGIPGQSLTAEFTLWSAGADSLELMVRISGSSNSSGHGANA